MAGKIKIPFFTLLFRICGLLFISSSLCPVMSHAYSRSPCRTNSTRCKIFRFNSNFPSLLFNWSIGIIGGLVRNSSFLRYLLPDMLWKISLICFFGVTVPFESANSLLAFRISSLNILKFFSPSIWFACIFPT